jgi:hypothetical protein
MATIAARKSAANNNPGGLYQKCSNMVAPCGIRNKQPLDAVQLESFEIREKKIAMPRWYCCFFSFSTAGVRPLNWFDLLHVLLGFSLRFLKLTVP